MTKKQEFLRSEQSRAKHPEREQVGGMSKSGIEEADPADPTRPPEGKVAHEHNKAGNKTPTQTHQSQRTPESRHDRQNLGSGPQNQVSARKGGGGAGRTPRGAG